MATVVIMPGGFHPFHAGHLALYQSAQRAFPDAEVYVAATNDTAARPFPFPVKEKLAKLAGVEPGHFVQVKSPFRAEEITAQFDPQRDNLIFVRSEKDSDKPPQAGGVKRDGSASYLQPLLGAKKLEPFAKHAYMAYLPTVEFGPGMTSATQIRTAWPTLDQRRKTALVMSLYPRTQGNEKLAANVVGLLDAAIGGEQGVAEGVNDYLWHGSKSEHEILYPQQANDTGGKEESNKNAVYATPSAKVAIAMGLTTPDSDTGMFPNDPQMIMFSGKIRKGQMVYLHKVPKNLFIKHNDREWYSKPGVKEVKPLEIKAVPVDQWLHLIRQATPQDLELRKKHMKKQGVAESVEFMSDAQFYGEILSVLAAMGAGLATGAYLKARDIVKMYNADRIMRALEGYRVGNISDAERQALTKLIAEFKQAMAQRQGEQALAIANQIKSIATDRTSVAEGWKDVVAGGAIALGALGASAQSMPNINAQQVELTNKYYKVLVQRAVEDGRTLDARTKNFLMSKAQDAAAQKIQKSTAQTAQTKPQFPGQGSEQRRAKDFDQFESADVEENQGWAATLETVSANGTVANTSGAGAGMTASYQRRDNQPIAEDYLSERRL